MGGHRTLQASSFGRAAPLVRLLLVILLFAPSAGAVTIAGVDYMSLQDAGGRLGMKHAWLKTGKQARLSSRWTKLDFTLHKRDMMLDGVKVHLGNPVALHAGVLHISELDFSKTLLPVLAPQAFKPVPKLYHIMIDPGHGDHDPGSSNKRLGIREKDLALDISKRLGAMLAKRGYKVSYTRTGDTFIPLEERSAMARRAGADLFISVHLNGGTPKVRGVETFAFPPRNQPPTSEAGLRSQDKQAYPGNGADAWNLLMAYHVQRKLKALGSPDRGVKRARFAVLRNAPCPAILVEGGFVSNDSEGRTLRQAAHRDKIARAIADGVHAYQIKINQIRAKR